MANEDLDESTQDSGKGLNGDAKKDKKKICMQCGALKKKLKFKVFYKGEQVQLCNEDCFKAFKDKQPKKKDKCEACHEEIDQGGYLCSHLGAQQPLCSAKCFELTERKHAPRRVCFVCIKHLTSGDPDLLLWETLEFCGVPCLRKYQLQIGAQCANCHVVVQETSLGKYCVRFGADIRQFCTGKCLEEFKKGLKVCAYCQRDLTREKIEPIVAQVGDKCAFKDFCSRDCVKNYESLTPVRPIDPAEKCKICSGRCHPKQLQLKYGVDDKELTCACSEPCVARFRYNHKLDGGYCENCHCFRTRPGESITLQLGVKGPRKKFCTKTCLNLFVLTHRKIVPCCWCKVKKYNFDMIERYTGGDVVQLFCSIYCLNLHKAKTAQVARQAQQQVPTVQAQLAQQVVTQTHRAQQSLLQNKAVTAAQQHQVQQLLQQQQAAAAAAAAAQQQQQQAAAAAAVAAQQQKQQQQQAAAKSQQGFVKCDQCGKLARPQFHLTMSDASVRNFCCYNCTRASRVSKLFLQDFAVRADSLIISLFPPLDFRRSAGNKVVLGQTVNLAQVQAQSAQAQVVSHPNHMAGKRISSQTAAQLSQMPQMPQVVAKVSTPVTRVCPGNAQVSITQTGGQQVTVTQSSHMVPQTSGAVAGMVQLPPGVVHLNNMPIIVRPPPPRDMRNKSVQCKPSEEEDQRDSDRIDEAVTGKRKPVLKGVLLDIEQLRGNLDGDKLVEFEAELQSLAKKLAERLVKETKVNGGVNNHDGPGGRKRPRDDAADDDEQGGQENGDLEGDKENNKRFKDESQELVDEALQRWSEWTKQRRAKADASECDDLKLSSDDFSKLSPEEMNQALCAIGKDSQDDASTEDILRLERLFLGLQLHLERLKHKANIFTDGAFCAFNDYLVTLTSSVEPEKVDSSKLIPEDLFWRTNQLGVASPDLLLNTVAFVIAKHVHMSDPDAHEELKLGKVVVETQDVDGTLKKVLRVNDKVVQENVLNKDRCPVAIVEAYISKCGATGRSASSSFYLEPKNASSSADRCSEKTDEGEKTSAATPATDQQAKQWFGQDAMDRDGLARTLSRFKVVRMH
ncbi:zinc finger MYM-type protein 2-like [Tropilaelaps mercedesae]|uniref:Zinc finger MYM-type protein 2-like n=1 Tax=Tropilaelaps mercedesae TaxID=418985 RepID=A0A1V9XJ49_9ACAR|nr:zinc finger MYM-type protein 2-like [Tropilaelaps mercedesae]